MTFSRKHIFLSALISILFLGAVIKTYATPSTYFNAGQTLDPVADDITCAPGVCSVYPLSIGDPVGDGNAGSVLFLDSSGLVGQDYPNFLYDNSDGSLYSVNTSLSGYLNIPNTSSSSVGVITKGNIRFIHAYKPAGTNDNLFVGKSSGNFTLSATSNFNGNNGFGQSTLTALTTGYFNVAIGSYTGLALTTGFSNTLVGTQVARNMSTGSSNVAIGDAALYGGGHVNHSATDNVAIGATTLYYVSTASKNVAIGKESGLNMDTGTNNVFVGYQSGHDITTETGNVFLGYQAGYDAAGSDKLYIENSSSESPLIYGDFANDYVNINGRLGIGTSTPDYELESVSESQNIEFVGTAYAGKKIVFGGRSSNGTEGTPSPSVVGDILAEFSGLGYGATAFAPSTTGGMRVYAEETTFTDTARGTQLRFMTTGLGSSTLSQRMTITADGNVGIGDTTPDELLNISSQTSNGIAITSVGADVDPYIKFELVDGTSSFTMGVDDSDGDSFKISTTALGTSDRFIIDSSGNVNIGGDGTPGDLFSVGSTSQFQISSSGAITAVTGIITTGAVTVGSSGTGALNVGTTAGTYRTTNAGSNITPQTVFDVDNSNSSSGSQAYMFDTTNGLVFTAANGTRRVARASIDIINLTNTAGSETGDLAFFTKPSGSAISEKMRIDSTGKVGIGDTSPDYLLDIENTGSDTDIFALTDSDGSCLHNPEAGSETVTCSSDERLKENITDAEQVLPYFSGFRIREYDVKSSGDHMTGVIAQEVMTDYPELVRVGGNGFYTVELPSTWQVIKALQELDIKIQDLRSLDLENTNSLSNILVTWFADSANGIGNLFAKKVTVEELCVEDVCITKDDLINILQNSNQDSNPVINQNPEEPTGNSGETSTEQNIDPQIDPDLSGEDTVNNEDDQPVDLPTEEQDLPNEVSTGDTM